MTEDCIHYRMGKVQIYSNVLTSFRLRNVPTTFQYRGRSRHWGGGGGGGGSRGGVDLLTDIVVHIHITTASIILSIRSYYTQGP